MQLSDRRFLGFPLVLGLLSFVHLINDLPAGMLPIVLLHQREALTLSLTQVGLVAGIYNFSVAIAQPLFGHLADRFGQRRFILGGVIWGVLLAGGLGFAPSFSILLCLASFSAIGSAAFHPPGFARASQVNPIGRGLGVSIFLVGGTMGYALGPLIAGNVFEITGLPGTGWITLGLLALILGLAMLMPLAQPVALASQRSQSSNRQIWPILAAIPRTLWLGIIALLLVNGVRTWLQWSISTYLPQELVALGFTPVEASQWLAFFLVMLAGGILAGGPLADRFGPRMVITGSLALLALFLGLFVYHAPWSLGLLVGLAGACSGLPLSVMIVVGQSFLPESAGLASGLVVGSSFVTGAAGVALTGLIADQWGLTVAFMGLGVLALMAALIALLLLQTPNPQATSA